jgi:hypothetical protein
MANMTDATYVRAFGRIPLGLTDAEITIQIPGAAVTLKKWVTEATYTTVLAEIDAIRAALSVGQTLESNGNLSLRQRCFRDAETNIVLARLVKPMNLVFADQGINTSIVSDRGNVNALRPDQEKEKIKEYERAAKGLVWEYQSVTGLGGGKARATDDEGNYI